MLQPRQQQPFEYDLVSIVDVAREAYTNFATAVGPTLVLPFGELPIMVKNAWVSVVQYVIENKDRIEVKTDVTGKIDTNASV